MTEISTHLILLDSENEFDPEGQALESKCGLLDVNTGDALKINGRLYQARRVRTNTKTKDGISLTMQFIYVAPLSQQALLTRVRDAFNT